MAATRLSPSASMPFLERWARISHRRRGTVIGAWVLALVATLLLSVRFGGEFQTEFQLPGAESQRAADLLNDRFPAQAGDAADIVFEAPGSISDPAIRARMEKLFADTRAIPGVLAVQSPYETPPFVSSDGTIARAIVQWSETRDAVDHDAVRQFLLLVEAANSDGLTVEGGGQIVAGIEQPEIGSEMLGLGLAVIILLIAFGSVVAAGLPIGAAVFGIGFGFATITLAARLWAFPSFAPQFAGMIGIGVGIDYSLLVVTRFREGIHSGRTVEDSVVVAVTTAGRSVIFAGIVVAIAFLGLFAMGIPFIAAMGVTGAIVVGAAVLVSLTLMPALLSLAGNRVDAWRIPLFHTTEGVNPNGGWTRLSEAIQRRPLVYFFSASIVLLFLASPVLDMRLGFTDAGNQPTSFPTRRAYDLLTKGFGAGYNGPLIVVADVTNGGKDSLEAGAEALRETAGVAYVSPITFNPTGDTAVFTLIPSTSPQDEATTQLVHLLRGEVIPAVEGSSGAELWVAGSNAAQIDIQDQIRERMPFLFAGVIGLSFILLTVVFRSLFVAAKAAIMNLLSIGASYGVVVAIFQWGWFSGIVGVEPGPVEVFLPMMFFAILFGLSMDYEVFLISRIREEYVVTKNNATAVAHGLAATARVITAAAAIMVCVFLSFVLGDDRIIKEFGIGLATAIFVDATIVRLVLVPATMELLGDRNWWLPGWLDRRMPHLNVEGTVSRPPVPARITNEGSAGGS